MPPFLERLLVYLAWRRDKGTDFDPAKLSLSSLKTICDIGCSNGGILRKFKSLGYEVTGIDPDPQPRVVASDAGTIREGTGENLPDDILGVDSM